MEKAVSLVVFIMYEIIGFLIFTGKFPFLVAGYLTTRKEDRTKYNWTAIGKFVAVMMWISSIGLGMVLIQNTMPLRSSIADAGVYFFLGTILLGGIYVNLSKRFRN